MRKTVLAVMVLLLAVELLVGCGGDKGTGTVEPGPELATITFRSDIDDIAAVPVFVFLDGEKLGPTPYVWESDDEWHTISFLVLGQMMKLGKPFDKPFRVTSSTELVFPVAQFGIYLAKGDVRTEDDASPLAGVKVEAMGLDEVTVLGSVLTQSDGSFELYILKDFTSSLRFSKDGYETQTIPIAEIPETGMDIRLAKIAPTTLTLNITPRTAEPEVWVNGDSLGSADAQGQFQATLDPGTYEIRFIGWGCKELTSTITLAPGETKSQNIQLEVWDLSGTWKRESDDLKIDVEKEADERGIYWFSFNPCWLTTKGNRVFKPVSQAGDYAEGIIFENGKRLEFTFHSQYGSTLHVYEKL